MRKRGVEGEDHLNSKAGREKERGGKKGWEGKKEGKGQGRTKEGRSKENRD